MLVKGAANGHLPLIGPPLHTRAPNSRHGRGCTPHECLQIGTKRLADFARNSASLRIGPTHKKTREKHTGEAGGIKFDCSYRFGLLLEQNRWTESMSLIDQEARMPPLTLRQHQNQQIFRVFAHDTVASPQQKFRSQSGHSRLHGDRAASLSLSIAA